MSSAPRVIFHYPRPIPTDPGVGSAVRVAGMLRGFEQIGADVTVVDGWSGERSRTMRSILRSARRGTRFDAVYSEFTTMPTMLTDPSHLPRHPLADLAFLAGMRRQNVGTGVFYRDVQWRFEPYRQRTTLGRRTVARAAYLAELVGLHRAVDVLFLPSLPMAQHLPTWRGRRHQVIALPPGSSGTSDGWVPEPHRLRLLYVGGVRPPVYDMTPLLEAVERVEAVDLVVCCPEHERTYVERWLDHPRITVVHEHGDALARRYEQCDAACMFYPYDPYREFAVPVKLFEAIGYGRPTIARADDFAGRYVAEHGLGWGVTEGSLVELLERLVDDPDDVTRRHDAVVAVQDQHTWEARCRLVVTELSGPASRRRPSTTRR